METKKPLFQGAFCLCPGLFFRFYGLKMAYLCIFFWVSLTACKQEKSSQVADNQLIVNDSTDLYPTKSQILFSRNFQLEYGPFYKKLWVFTPQGGDTTCYILLQRGYALPPELSGLQVIEIPVRTWAVGATSHVGFLSMLGLQHQIVGLDSEDYVCDSLVLRRLEAGQVRILGSGGSIDREQVMALQPELVVVSGMPANQQTLYRPLLESGIAVFSAIEWMERTALGRAEWCKVFAAFSNQEALVNPAFEAVAERYRQLANKASATPQKPWVISGSPYRDHWHVPGKHSYVGDLLRAAGARWQWENDSSAVSLPLDFEAVYPSALSADFWVFSGTAQRLDDLTGLDRRFAQFKAVKQQQVYNNTLRMNPKGLGIDYWESGVVRPDLILEDLIAIFHPSLLEGHRFTYFKQLD
jgi:iron complex transport system substrate-binding protein